MSSAKRVHNSWRCDHLPFCCRFFAFERSSFICNERKYRYDSHAGRGWCARVHISHSVCDIRIHRFLTRMLLVKRRRLNSKYFLSSSTLNLFTSIDSTCLRIRSIDSPVISAGGMSELDNQAMICVFVFLLTNE